jgi:two-component system response regulator HydG
MEKTKVMENNPNPSGAALPAHTGLGGLIGASAAMQRLYDLIGKVSQHCYPVLILGESGTGKELVARSIHDLGPRRDKPFAPVDCSALVPTLIESELFGHAKGAFTGADKATQGLFESADEGTLFLDEVGELPVDLQAKLLRVLQEKEIRPIGSTERIPINVRVIAATHRDLEAAVRGGTFRQDLYFRLNVVQIAIPPLRQRRDDIPLLAGHFLQKFSDPQMPVQTITETAMRRLMAYNWPGNVRELENAIESAVALSSDAALRVDDFSSIFQSAAAQCLPEDDKLLLLEKIERRAIFRALRETSDNKIAAARLLGIGKSTLYRKLEAYARDSSQFKPISASKEVFHVVSYLICLNAQCRNLFEIQDAREGYYHLRNCQKCGHIMKPECPFCQHLLKVAWKNKIPHCSHCGRELKAEGA